MANLAQHVNLIPRGRDGQRIFNPVFSKLRSRKVEKHSSEFDVYTGDIPGIVGLIVLLVNYRKTETFVFARKDNAVAISEKYGRGFKRFLGEVRHDPRPFQRPKVSYNYWDAIFDEQEDFDDTPTEEDQIVAYELSKNQVNDAPPLTECDHDPYASQRDESAEEDESEKIADPDKLTPKNFSTKIQEIIDDKLTDIEKRTFDLWKRGFTTTEIAKQLSLTDGNVTYKKRRLHVKLGEYYNAKNAGDFASIITQIGNSYREYQALSERNKLRRGGVVSEDSSIFKSLTVKEGEVLGLMRRGMTHTAIASKLAVSTMAISGFKKRIIHKIGDEIFYKVVNNRLRFDTSAFEGISKNSNLADTDKEELTDFRSGINFDILVNAHEDELDLEEEIEEIFEQKAVDNLDSITPTSDNFHILKILRDLGEPVKSVQTDNSGSEWRQSNDPHRLFPQQIRKKKEIVPEPNIEVPQLWETEEDPNFEEKSQYLTELINTPLPPSFQDFIAVYGNGRDSNKAEEKYNHLTDEEKLALMSDVPKYLKLVLNPAYKKSPLAYITGNSWK
ncbi:hypothetical protein LZG74_16935 [Dyadobacter sp. CY327]|uniref:helix-turn-helix transcriptional regulator n=1 Tax=Dyadobacter sp. CY327 TaxID=2907301 RepID=UPI001F3201FD|nr:hypothetical protein [Dyadobacter sp. CY327]MCE7072004.1 hypothetical protein [Dyadobacter sp. CY327]